MFDKEEELKEVVEIVEVGNRVATHQLVGVERTGVSFSDVHSFSNNIFAVIGKFDVVRLRDELAVKFPCICAFEVWISISAAFTDWDGNG